MNMIWFNKNSIRIEIIMENVINDSKYKHIIKHTFDNNYCYRSNNILYSLKSYIFNIYNLIQIYYII